MESSAENLVNIEEIPVNTDESGPPPIDVLDLYHASKPKSMISHASPDDKKRAILEIIEASIFRCDLISFLYFAALLVHKFSFIFYNGNDLKKHITVFTCVVSSITIVSRTVYHIVYLFVTRPTDEADVSIGDLFGFMKITSLFSGIQQFLPDFLVLSWSILLLVLRIYNHSESFHRRSRKKSKTAAFITSSLMLIYIALICIIAAISPNILSLPYTVYIILEICLWASVSPFDKYVTTLRYILLVYNILHSFLIYIFQIDLLRADLNISSRQIFGLYDYTDSQVTWYQIIYIFTGISITLLLSTHGHVASRYQLSLHLIPFTDDLGIVKNIFGKTKSNSSNLISRAGDYILRNGSRISTIMIITSAITFPSYLLLPLLLWACLTIVLPISWFYRTSIIATIYFGVVILFQTIWNIESLPLPSLPDVGLQMSHPSWAFIGLQLILFYTFSLICYPWDSSSGADSHTSLVDSLVSRPESRIADNANSNNQNRTWFDMTYIKDTIMYCWWSLYHFILEYAYLISLVVLYICGLQDVNIINTVFLLFFISFLIFPKLARIAWISLVIYTEVIIILQFIWQFSYLKNNPIENARLWGLQFEGTLWYQIRFHLVILAFTVLQLNTYELLAKKERQNYLLGSVDLPVSDETNVPAYIRDLWIRNFALNSYSFFKSLAIQYTLLASYLTFSLICLLKPVTLFDLGYLAIFFYCLVCHQIRSSFMIEKCWIAICLYPAVVMSSCYVFQFVELEEFLNSILGTTLLLDIGLVSVEGTDLFAYLLQHIVALFLCVLQFRIFRKQEQYSAIFGENGSLADWVQQIVLPAIHIFKRFCIIHLSKIIYVLTFFMAISQPSLIGLLTVCYLVFVVPFPKNQRSTRLFLTVWIQFVVFMQLVYQLRVIQTWVTSVGDAAFFGFVRFDSNTAPINYMGISVALLYVLALQVLASQWKAKDRTKHPDFPENETEWPILDLDSLEDVLSPTTFMKRGKLPKESAITVVNYWISNFFYHFGFEIVMCIYAAVGLQKLSIIGLIFLLMLGFCLLCGPKLTARLWGSFVLINGCLIIFQYCSAIGYPPFTNLQLPWKNLQSEILLLLGLPVSPNGLDIIPDFFLLLFSCFQWAAFLRRQYPSEVFREWNTHQMMMTLDFTAKPRGHINQFRFFVVRYMIWIPILFVFVEGTLIINLPGFIFLCFALYFISSGESSLMNRMSNVKAWSYLTLYIYTWFVLQVAYQFPAYLIPLPNDNFDSNWSSKWRIFFGLDRMTKFDLNGYPVFSTANQILVVAFLAILGQRRLNESNALYYVVRYLKSDSQKAVLRAKEYQARRVREVDEQKMQYEYEVNKLREQVQEMKSYQKDVDDWVRLYGRRENEYGYAIIDRIDDADRKKYDIVDLDSSDPLMEHRHDRLTLKRGNSRNSSIQLYSGSELRQRSNPRVNETSLSKETIYEEDSYEFDDMSDEERKKKAREILKRHHYWYKMIDSIISFLFTLSSEYTDLYTTQSDMKLYHKEENESRLWALFRGIYHTFCAHTALITYITVFANQVYHANLLSMFPTLAVLLWGICQRPYPGRLFWQSMIIFIEITIFIKFFFQFDVWQFNRLKCPIPDDLSDPVWILGIQHACGSFFSEVITEFAILISCIFHRAIMRRLGLWKFYEEIKTGTDIEQSPENIALPEIHSNDSSVEDLENVLDMEGNEVATPLNSSIEDLVIEWQNDSSKNPVKNWFRQKQVSLVGYFDESRLPGKDYYLGYFIADFLVFIFTIIFWPSFSGDYSSDSNIQFLYSVFNQNTVPALFVGIMILNFCLILADRAIYTSKSLKAKFALHIVTVLVFTFWIFFILPISNNERFVDLRSLQLWFFIKCVYWYFSSLQIKSGFPRVRINNFLMRNYSNTNRIGFMVFRSIPFLWEIRTILDWTLTETTLNLYYWMKFEDIFANIYLVKAGREFEKNFPRKFGEVQNRFWKRFNGVLMLAALVGLLWFPLIILSIPGTTKINPIQHMQITVQIAGFEPLYVQSITQNYISNFTNGEFDKLKRENPSLFPSYFASGILQQATFDPSAESKWLITPPSKSTLVSMLNNTDSPLLIYTSWDLETIESSLSEVSKGYQSTTLSPESMRNLSMAINSTTPGTFDININSLYPQFLHAFPSGPVVNLAPGGTLMTNVTLRYIANEAGDEWWDLLQVSNNGAISNPTFKIFSDNVPVISSLSSYGIIGLYVAVVLAAGRFIRILITDLTLRIIYEDLPNPDPVVKLCSDIILAREFGDFETEETLYWFLITLFRSPEKLLEKTRIAAT